ncbi:MAG: DUF3971 domain-containing protein [Gammaproteobacteria bacterium]|nr:DUF3971 domain-containing protein [Gammaproteobacteria bacterium]
MNALLRTAFLIATITAICFALVQVVCRIVFWQLPHLESALNDFLADQGVAVQGIEGRWNGINPGLYADRIDFPAGQASGLDFELDLLESLGRNRFVARRLTIADGYVAFDKTPMGWRLRGASGAGGFDLRALLTHSDEVWLRGRIGLFGPSLAGTIHVESMLINQGGNHRFHIGLQTPASCPDCGLTIDGDITADGPGAARIAGESVVVDGDLVDLAGLGPLYAGANAKRIGVDLGVDWRREADGGEHLRLHLAANVDGLPGASAEVGLEAEAWRDTAVRYRGRIGSLSLKSGDAEFRLDGGGFVVRPGAREAELWLPTLALASLVGPVAQAFGPEHVLGRHIGRLTPRAWISAVGVHVDENGVAFQGHASEASTTGFKGVPKVANATFSFAGGQYAARATLDSRDVLLAFPDYLTAYATHDAATGSLTLVYAGDRVGLRGTDLLVRKDAMQATGNFALARRVGASHSHVLVDGRVNQVDVATAREYVPMTLAPELRKWLLDSVRSGELAGTRMVYQGRTTTTDDLPWRRFEMSSRFANATVAYHADWPTATDAEGQLAVTSRRTRMRGQAEAFGVHLPNLDLSVRHGDGDGSRAVNAAAVEFSCDTTVSRLFDFARATPVRDALPFLSDTWSGDGQVSVNAALNVPLGDRRLNPGDVRADFQFRNADLDLADIGLAFADINERLHFEYPANLSSNGLKASLFEAPVTIGITSDTDSVQFSVAGSATPEDAYRLMDIDDPAIAEGQFRYDALFTVFPNVDRAMELQVTSDLEGLTVRLPPPLAKSADDARTMTAAMQFLDSHVAVSARYGEADGWLHTADGSIRAGSIGIGASVPMIDAAEGRVVLGGGVQEIDSATMTELLAPSAGVDRPFAWELRRFSVGRMTLDEFAITDAVLDGFSDGGEVSFAIDAAELKGTVAKSGDAPWRVKLNELRLPAPVGEGDPLTTAAMDRLLPADVELDRVIIGDEDYGSWKLGLRPDANGVTLSDVVADVRGLHIESGGDVYWSRTGETDFDGEVSAGNLHDVLPLWGFAPSVESEAFHASGHVRWPGSPLNFDLAHLSGDAQLRVTNGRFLDVAQGATPILSLINFSTVAKRMNLDFSDVFGAGVSFEEVIAELTVDDGLARFTKAAEIVGTGSSFRLAGTVDLDSGALDNEMVVTLPVHASLPWAAGFLALSNPAGAAAVVVGRQVFKDQIRRLTSGKYRITGTYEEPEVAFEGVFADHADVAAGVDGSADSPANNEDPAQSVPATPAAAPPPTAQVPRGDGVEPSAGEREGPAPRMKEPSAGEREGQALTKTEPEQ